MRADPTYFHIDRSYYLLAGGGHLWRQRSCEERNELFDDARNFGLITRDGFEVNFQLTKRVVSCSSEIIILIVHKIAVNKVTQGPGRLNGLCMRVFIRVRIFIKNHWSSL